MLKYTIDKDSDTPLYMQIRNNIEDAILQGKLTPGDKLPSVNVLAKDIGVTQATVRRALQDLGEAGHTYCHVGRGTFIRDAARGQEGKPETSGNFTSSAIPANNKRPSIGPSRKFATRRLRMGIGKALRDIMSLADKPGIIRFTKGVPDPGLLPESFLQETTVETLQNGGNELLEATDPLGRFDLRREIAERFSKQGTPVSPDQVLITNGSMQAISLVAQANLEEDYKVICETPCFKGITEIFATSGQWVETITRDAQGPMPELPKGRPGENPFLLYLCPYAHNPMGTNLSNERYSMVVEWAGKTGSLVLTDEIFRDLCFDQNQQPSLMQELGAEQTVVVSSLSKSVMTGLRLGWLISSPQRVQQLAELKRLMDHSCPSLIQGLGLTVFTSGYFDSHTRNMQAIYKSRRDTLLNALDRYMPKEVTWVAPEGGFSLLLELPRGYSSVAMFLAAIEKGVAFLPGPLFDIDHRFVHCFRLSYAWADEEQIKEGIELLASAVENFISRPPGDSGLSGIGSYQ
ncbi:MAG: PLP-dependent aminotransferase family protein [Desulforhopalus sp.]